MNSNVNNEDLDLWLNGLKRDGKTYSNNFPSDILNVFTARGFVEKGNEDYGSFEIIITNSGRTFCGFVKESENEKERQYDRKFNQNHKKISTRIAIIAMVISILSFLISVYTLFIKCAE